MTVRSGRLVEREGELEALERLLGAAGERTGGAVVVEGPPGIGKSSLLAAARAAAGELRVVSARGGDLERELPFGIVRQLLEPVLVGAGDAEREALLMGAAALAEPVLSAPDVEAGAEPPFAALHGLYWFVVNLASERPLLAVVDDVQSADLASLRWLVYLARRLEGVPLALILGCRPQEGGPAQELLDELVVIPEVGVLHPGDLSEGAVGGLVAGALAAEPDREFVAACHAATGGNPFLVSELLGELARRGVAPSGENAGVAGRLSSEGVGRAVRGRLRRLGLECAALARAVAVLGDPAEPTLAARLAELDEDAAWRAADRLAEVSILEPGPPLAFVHPLVRASVYAGLSASERAAGHERAARLLTDAGAAADRMAVHLLAARPRASTETVTTLRRAAVCAGARGAPEVAVAYLRRAVEERPPQELRPVLAHELGAAALRAGELDTAIERPREAIALLDAPAERARAGLLLGRALYAAGESGLAADAFERAMADAPASARELGHRLEYELSNALVGSLRLAYAVERAERVYERRPSGDGAGTRSLLATLAWLATFVPRSRAESVELASAALAGDGLLEEDTSDAFWTAAMVFLSAEQYDLARVAAARALERAVRRGSVHGFVWALYYRARLSLLLGRLVDAEADARDALGAVERHGLVVATPWLESVLAEILLARGRLDEAAAIVGSTLPGEREREHALVLVTRADVLLGQGRPEAALAEVEILRRRYRAAGRDNRAARWRPPATRALAALERRDEALALAREEVELARRWGAPRALGRALRVAGMVEGGADGLELLRQAVDALDRTAAGVERALALLELGSALRRAGRRAEAREPLREALKLARRCGADAVAARAHDELVAAGVRPRRDPTGSGHDLTASELRVARMAADGMTNREIAQTLFVTENTIHTHLKSVFRELAISSRSQLSRAL